MESRKKKFNFKLEGVNLERVNKKYGTGHTEFNTNNDIIPEFVTKIEDLEPEKKIPEVISFLDETKRLRKCFLSVINFSKHKKKQYKCFWDKHDIPDTWQPLGCPIKYVPSNAIKSYHSEISKEQYTISEPMTEKNIRRVKEKGDKRFCIEKKGSYETDGVFCSFNCIVAYYQDPENRKNQLYTYSEMLCLQMYHEMNEDTNVIEIMPSPHWRTLECFGGHLSIEKFRECFNRVFYTDYGIISTVSIGRLYSDTLKF